MKINWLRRLLIGLGAVFIGLSLFANLIGMDNNATWGISRVFILLIGLLCILTARFYDQIIRAKNKIEIGLGSQVWSRITATLLISLVLLIYVWLVSVGLWTTFPKSSVYYDWLATSFQQGHLYLPFNPDPALLALPNPYETSARTGINWIMDATLFNNKYYLYFGPAPALLITFLKFFISTEIGDQHLVFAFACGIFIFEFLLLQKIYRGYFTDIPLWLLYLGLLGIGLANPFVIMLLSPGVHAAAITSGQFFLIGGLYFLYLGLETGSPANLALASSGIFLAMAVGSRSTLVIPVITLTVIFMLTLFTYDKTGDRGLLDSLKNYPALVSFGVPLCIGAIILCWYNWARFGSITEFGFMYQLTTNNLQQIKNDLFAPAYILQNLYNYFINPYRFIAQFPILELNDGKRDSIVSFIHLPKTYFTENMVGLLYSQPYIIFSVVSIIEGVKKVPDKWIRMALGGMFLSALLPLLAFFWVAFRYTADFFPALSLLSVLGIWDLTRRLKGNKIGQYIFFGIIWILIIYSITASGLISISNAHGRFKIYNPELLEWMKQMLYFR